MSEPEDRTERRRARPTAVAVVAIVIAILLLAAGSVVSPRWGSDPWSSYADGWTKLPLPPNTGSSTTYVWTDAGLVSWGGGTRNGGNPLIAYVLDPRSKTWTPTAPAPLTGPIWGPRDGNSRSTTYPPMWGSIAPERLA